MTLAVQDSKLKLQSAIRLQRLWNIDWQTLSHVVALVVAVFLGAMVSVHLGQDTNGDFYNYHYYDGYALTTGVWRTNIAPAQLQTYLNPTLDFLMYLLYSHFPPIVVGAVLGGFQGISYWLVYEIAWVALAQLPIAARAILSVSCAAMAFYSPTSISEIGNTMGDLTVSVPVLAGVLLLMLSLRNTTRSLLYVGAAGLLMGFAGGVKYTVLIYVVAACLTLGLTAGDMWLKRLLVLAGSFLVGFAVTAGYWMIALYSMFGSPLFPLYNGVFRSVYGPPTSFVDARWFPTYGREWLLLPFDFTSNTVHPTQELPFQDISFAITYVLLAVAILAGIGLLAYRLLPQILATRAIQQSVSIDAIKGLARGAVRTVATQDLIPLRLMLLLVLGYILWEKEFSNYRYLVTIGLIVPVVICILVGWIVRSRQAQVVITLILFGVSAAAMFSPDWGHVPWGASVVNVTPPPLTDPQHTMVVIVGNLPFSYTIPDFPQQVQFVAFDTNMNGVESQLFVTKEQDAVENHQGPLYFLTYTPTLDQEAGYIHTLGFTVEKQSCVPLQGAVFPGSFCQLTK